MIDAKGQPLAGISVLIVDDDPRSLEMYRFVLEEAGATVECSPSALLAAEALERSCPDVLISDIVMPQMTGLDLIEALRTREDDCACVAAIAVTAFSDELSLERARRAGFDRAVPKPLSPLRLMQLVREVSGVGASSGEAL
jgi:CheY-like chemotaxis protein